MRYALVSEHHHYFEEHGFIEFEDLVAPFELPAGVGRDLWRDHPYLEELVKSKKLTDIAISLMRARPLRLLYDEVILERGEAPLEETSAFQGVLGGWLLKPSGEGTFYSATTPLPVEEGPLFLIVYGKESVVYSTNAKDPYRLALRTLGYEYGDRLRDATHPVLCSR